MIDYRRKTWKQQTVFTHQRFMSCFRDQCDRRKPFRRKYLYNHNVYRKHTARESNQINNRHGKIVGFHGISIIWSKCSSNVTNLSVMYNISVACMVGFKNVACSTETYTNWFNFVKNNVKFCEQHCVDDGRVQFGARTTAATRLVTIASWGGGYLTNSPVPFFFQFFQHCQNTR